MPEKQPIFGLRFGSNAAIAPDRAELASFLASPKRARALATHTSDLAPYRDLVDRIARFDKAHELDPAGTSVQDRMLYGALRHSELFNPALLSSVELYKYFHAALTALDLRKPASFIAAAKREIDSLDPAKKPDAGKIVRLKGLIEDRKRMLNELEHRKDELERELIGIACYVRDNLITISLLCEKAIVLLVKLLTEGVEERRLLDDVKDLLRKELKSGLQQGRVTPFTLLSAKQELELLSAEIKALLREDLFTITSVYESVQEHALTMARRLDDGLAAAAAGPKAGQDAFSALEEVLVRLMAGPEFALKVPRQPRPEVPHGSFLKQKREEMLVRFFDQVRSERRERKDRRTETSRRADSGNAPGIERRSGKDRRSGKGRRR